METSQKQNNIIEIPIEYKRLFDSEWREAAIYGGRFSLKSHSVARVLLIRARQSKIRVACFREYQNSIADSSYQLLVDLIKLYGLTDFKTTDNSIVNTINGSDFIFKGLRHNEQSIKSIEGIDVAWVEEAQTVSTESLEVLTPTVRKPGSQIIYTYNRLKEDDPVHKRLVVEGRPNTLIIKTDYTVAQKYGFLPKEVLLEIESDKLNRPKLFKYKWMGEPVTSELKIYRDWQIIDNIPHEARLVRYGLDFGYTNDPSTGVAIYEYNGGYILDEVFYQKGLNNRQIADIFNNVERAMVVADSAEPKSIDEIKLYGVNIIPCIKGRDSVQQGIQFVQGQRVFVTSRSVNIIKEYNNYMWFTDREGRILNEPEHTFSHCFAPDTIINTVKGKFKIKDLVGTSGWVFSRDGKIERFNNVRPTRVNADVLTIHFNDSTQITVTPDHLLLLPTGEWIESSLLCPKDMIQLDIYDKNLYLQWLGFLKISFRQILQGICLWKEVVASSLRMDNRKGGNTREFSCSSQRQEPRKQFCRQLGTCAQIKTSKRAHDTSEEKTPKTMGGCNKTAYKEVAFVRRGNQVAQITWQENMGETQNKDVRLLPLPCQFFNEEVWKERKVLFQQLQNESKAKKITRITRGRCAVTYNLDVENTHALSADGVIAHNSMDAVRYGFDSLRPQEELSDIEKAMLWRTRRANQNNSAR